MIRFDFFAFNWTHRDEYTEEGLKNTIRIYGINKKNESVYVKIPDFQIPMWIELPKEIEWTEHYIRVITNQFMNVKKEIRPTHISFQKLHKLYYAEVKEKKDKDGNKYYEKKKFPYLCAMFDNTQALEIFKNIISTYKGYQIDGIGKLKFKCHCFERSITPVLKLFAVRNLPSSGWITGIGKKVCSEDKESTKKHEYICSFTQLMKTKDDKIKTLPIVYPKVLSFDNEAYSSVENSMPNSKKPEDKVFQIGCTLLEQNGKNKTYKKYLLSLGEPSPIDGVIVKHFKTEYKLYVGFMELIKETDPDIIIGYNIFGWDITYMNDRMLFFGYNWNDISSIKGKDSIIKEINWESSAYGKQDMKYIESEGRLFIDLLPYIKRNYKLHNYRLETVCDEFLKNINKDPLKAKDMFKLYKENKPEGLSLIGKYCAQDSYVTLLLYEKLLIWFDLVEASTTNGVPMLYLYTKGQQIKMYSQVLQYCIHNNIVVESNAYIPNENDNYTGAFVEEPINGLYKGIVPFDFASLYPSIIMAYNIDYSKLVVDENIPDEDCNVFIWNDHVQCEHDPKIIEKKEKERKRKEEKERKEKDKIKKSREKQNKLSLKNGDIKIVQEEGKNEEDINIFENPDQEKPKSEKKVVCASYHFRFLKADKSEKGVIPTLLENLIRARKNTRKQIEENEKLIDNLKNDFKQTSNIDFKDKIIKDIENLEELNLCLDKRQLSYKISANSMYGAMGVKKGYLPFLQGAMCVTAKGRESIHKASDYLQNKCGGTVIYNDTDSAYTYFKCLENKPMNECWDYVEKVVQQIVDSKLFPSPMKLEFEGKIYNKFLILTKKRYVAQPIDRDGNVSSKLVKRGIVLQRRDNCQFLRDIYQMTIDKILKYIDIITNIKDKNLSLRELQNIPEIKDILDSIIFSIDTLFQWKYNFKNFIITKTLTRLPKDYKGKRMPVHAFLASKMEKRGIPIQIGSRIEYLLLDISNVGYNKKELQQEKVEDSVYFSEFRELLRIDYLYYLRTQVVKPIDELIKLCLGIHKFMENQFEFRVNKTNLLASFKNKLKPQIIYSE
jgi:DNA polymerase elongation subunit (family B)